MVAADETTPASWKWRGFVTFVQRTTSVVISPRLQAKRAETLKSTAV
jgi:hypothetical protein